MPITAGPICASLSSGRKGFRSPRSNTAIATVINRANHQPSNPKAPTSRSHLPSRFLPAVLRIQISQTGVAFAATYTLMPGQSDQTSAGFDHAYAGDVSTTEDNDLDDQHITGDLIGPTQRGDTLAAIARTIRRQYSGAALSKIELSLYQANPLKFNHQDPLRLKPYVMLRVPDTVTIHLASTEQAQAMSAYLQGQGENPFTDRQTHRPSGPSYHSSVQALEQIRFIATRWWRWIVLGFFFGAFLGLAQKQINKQLRRWKTMIHGYRRRRQAKAQNALLSVNDTGVGVGTGEGTATPLSPDMADLLSQRIQQLEQRIDHDPRDVWLQVMLAREHLRSGHQDVFLNLAEGLRGKASNGQWNRVLSIAAESSDKQSLLAKLTAEKTDGSAEDRPNHPGLHPT